MEFKWTLIFGIILAIIVLAVASGVYMVDVMYVSPAAIITIIVLTLIFTKLYLGKVSATVRDMIVTSIIWIIVVAIIEAVYVFAMALDFMGYYSNYMIYVGYVMIIIFALFGFKLFGKKTGGFPAPAQKTAPAAEPTPAAAPEKPTA